MALWRTFYHFVWATKDRLPLITPEIEQNLYGYIIGKADYLGCITHAIGGIQDHIHTVVSIPPKLAIAIFVKNVKGSSAYHINHAELNYPGKFGWQKGYGVFSVGENQLQKAVNYVINQKKHHQEESVISTLEAITDEDDGPVAWNGGKALTNIRTYNPLLPENEFSG